MKPILFNTEMVRAILEGRKTVTRRAVKPQPTWSMAKAEKEFKFFGYVCGRGVPYIFRPHCRPGDILYVRETWTAWSRVDGIAPALYYKANGNAPDGIKWHPSIHMPREAARIFLRVTDVRVEKLQSITEEQAELEGCRKWYEGTKLESSARSEFCNIWDSTIKPANRTLYGWEANPWVWVIEFKQCEQPEEIGSIR